MAKRKRKRIRRPVKRKRRKVIRRKKRQSKPKVIYATPWKTRAKSRYMILNYFHVGDGLRHQLLITYNDREGAHGEFKRQGQKHWLGHGNYYPPANQVPGAERRHVRSDIDKLFEKFKKSARNMDPNTRVKEGIGIPQVR